MQYKKRLFLNLLAALGGVFLIVSGATFFFATYKIEENIKNKATEMSTLLGGQLMYGHMGHMMKSDERASELLKDFGFYRFKISDPSGKTLVDEQSPDVDEIQRQIDVYEHTLKVYRYNEVKITIMHAHESNRYYLDIKMPWNISAGKKGELTAMYDATAYVQNFYDKLRMDLVGVAITFLLLFLAGYPTILMLQRGLLEKTKALSQTNIEILKILGGAVAKRDSDTNEHNYRVTLYAMLLAEALQLPKEQRKALMQGAFLHDVGKIGISDTILLKPAKLTEAEFEVMKQHVVIGKDIIQNSHLLDHAREIVEFHHEKFDGSGYLQGLKGEAIPLNARIFSIADVFDALTSKRPYKEAYDFDKAKSIMQEFRGTHFDPKLLDLFFEIIPSCYKTLNHHTDETLLKAMLREKMDRYYE